MGELGPRRRGAGGGVAGGGVGAPFPEPLQAQELPACPDFAQALRMRLLPTPSPGFLSSPRSNPEAQKLLVSAALLLCDCSLAKARLFAAAASVRLRRAGDAPGLIRL